jgi:hypothetical protein
VRTDLGIPVPEAMNYFEDKDDYRYPGLFYAYWLSTHPDAQVLPMNNGLRRIPIRYSTGTDTHGFLSDHLMALEGKMSATYKPVGPVSYRSFEELYEWVPLPLKQYSWSEISSEPILAQQIDGIQQSYLSILASSPYLATSSPMTFLSMKSWSTGNLSQLKKIIGQNQRPHVSNP